LAEAGAEVSAPSSIDIELTRGSSGGVSSSACGQPPRTSAEARRSEEEIVVMDFIVEVFL
jgi:hypothetical protein